MLAQARGLLEDQDEGRLESEILLVYVLGVSRSYLYANPDQEISLPKTEAVLDLVQRRAAGEPIAYLTGTREFWSLPLRVTPDVLIPRPETELLVEIALEFIPADARWRIADLGTGSGAIALAIASERPGCEIHATEYSEEALKIARHNIEALAPGKVGLHQGSWLEPLNGRFMLIVSNPPYVAAEDPHLQQGDCRFEPADALSPGSDALAAIRHIAQEDLDVARSVECQIPLGLHREIAGQFEEGRHGNTGVQDGEANNVTLQCTELDSNVGAADRDGLIDGLAGRIDLKQNVSAKRR